MSVWERERGRETDKVRGIKSLKGDGRGNERDRDRGARHREGYRK